MTGEGDTAAVREVCAESERDAATACEAHEAHEARAESAAAAGLDGIAAHRARIDELDAEIVRLLNERQTEALAIRTLKEQAGLPRLDADREREILARLGGLCEGPLDEAAIRAIYAAILSESKR